MNIAPERFLQNDYWSHGIPWNLVLDSEKSWKAMLKCLRTCVSLDYTAKESRQIQRGPSQYQHGINLSGFNSHFPRKPGLASFIGAKDDRSGGDNWSYNTC